MNLLVKNVKKTVLIKKKSSENHNSFRLPLKVTQELVAEKPSLLLLDENKIKVTKIISYRRKVQWGAPGHVRYEEEI